GPQLADRFALTVHLAGEADPARRAQVVRRRLEFEADPAGFRGRFQAATAVLAESIKAGRRRLMDIRLTGPAQAMAADLAREHRLAGHRGDLALGKAARARAALLGLDEAGPAEVRAVAELALSGRRRPPPPKRPARLTVTFAERAEKKELFEPIYLPDRPEPPPEAKGGAAAEADEEMITRVFKVGGSFRAVTPQSRREVGTRDRGGRRSARETGAARGRSARTSARRLGRPLSLSATLRAAAPWQAARRARAEGEPRLLTLTPADFREKVYRQKTGRLVVFVVDSSGSIGTLYRMEEAKAAALALLAEAYQKRDRVALIAFYGLKAELLLPPTNSPDLAARLLAELPSGGKTPMAAALALAGRLLRVEQAKDPALTPHVILMTDGRPNIPLTPGANPWTEVLTMAGLMAADPRLNFILIDTDRGAYNDYKLTRDLAERLRAPRLSLEELREGHLTEWLNRGSGLSPG
ncbi:MAG: VWA domain-containing protein, partial [Candidatus Adiutrix sp.]|nr:VWA domain-containing protein [Candidatus Adiutrix sp.]